MKADYLTREPATVQEMGAVADSPHPNRVMVTPPVKPNLTELVTRKIADLIQSGHNPRTHSEGQVAQIAASIAEFGFTNPVLIDERNTIIAGEGRVRAAKKARMTTVPCVVLTGLTDAQRAAYVIADNKLALNAGWDEMKLQAEFDRIFELDYDFNLTGFSEVEVAALLEDLDDIESGEKELAIQGSATRPESTGVEELAIEVDATQPDTAQPKAPNPWQGMPDFNQPEGGPFRTIKVHCKDQAAVNAFAKLIGQRLTDKTKWVWYPAVVKAVAEVVYA